MSIMVRQCFVCTGGIHQSGSQNSKENAVLLCDILEMSHLGNDDKNWNQIIYCRSCAGRILGIRRMLEELEKLEKKILDEKYLIEVQLKGNSDFSDDLTTDPRTPSDELRAEIVTEMRSTLIQSMLEKIRMRRVGRKLSRPRSLRIMQNVTIPEMPTPTNVKSNTNTGNKVHNRLPESAENNFKLPESLGPHHVPSSSSSSRRRFPIPMESSNVESDNLSQRQTSWTTDSGVQDYDVKCETVISDHYEESAEPFCNSGTEVEFFADGLMDSPIITTTVGVGSLMEQEVTNEFEEKFKPIHEDTEGSSPPPDVDTSIYGSEYNQLNLNDRLETIFSLGSNSANTSKRADGRGHGHGGNGHRNRSGISPYRSRKCEECGKVLSCHDTWKSHVLSIHRGQNPFKCHLCNYSCPKKATLRIHMMSHSDVRDFKCQICEKVYKYKGDLCRHMKKTHGKVKFHNIATF